MIDKILAIITVSMLIGFMSVVVIFVNEPDLWMVVLIGLGLASYDFWATFRKRRASAERADVGNEAEIK